MPTNDISINTIIANMALADFENNNAFVATAHRGYARDYPMSGYKQGDVINIRRRNFATVVDSRIMSADPIDEETVPLVIEHHYTTGIEVTAKELTLDMDTDGEYFNERYVMPGIKSIAKTIETAIATSAIFQLYNAIGTTGAPINSALVDLANAKLQEMSADLETKYTAITPRDGSSLRQSILAQFTPALNDDIARTAILGHYAGFDIFADQSIRQHTTGSLAGSPIVNGAVVSGNTIILDGATPSATGVFRAGDTIEIAGVNSVNKEDRSDTGQLMQFVVLADADADGGGNVTITVDPAIVSDLGSNRRNVTVPIPDNAAVTIYGHSTPGTPVTQNVNVFYTKRALDLVMPPLAPIDINRQYTATNDEGNISVRVGFDGDIKNDTNTMRIDCLAGWLWHGAYAGKMIS